MIRVLRLLALLLCTACSAIATRYVEPPQVEGARTVIIVASAPLRAEVYPLDEGRLIDPIRILVLDDASISAFYYDVSREDLGLGSDVLSGPASGRDCRLLSPRAGFALEPEGWVASAGAPPLAESSTCRPVPCPTFDARIFDLGSAENTVVAVALDEEHGLVATYDGEFFAVDRSGVSPIEELRGMPSSAGLNDGETGLWLGGRSGRIARKHLDGRIEELPSRPANEEITALAKGDGRVLGLSIDRPGGTGDIFTIRLLEVWPDPKELGTTVDRANQYGGAIAVLGRRALAVYSGNSALAWDGAETTVVFDDVFDRRYPETQRNSANGVAALGDSFVIGGGDGHLYLPRADGEWAHVPDPHLAASMDVLTPADFGLLFAGDDGAGGVYRHNQPGCGPTSIFAANIRAVAKVGSSFIVAGERTKDGHAQLYWHDVR